MALELRQQLKLTQQLIMTPQLQMAIKLLQLSRLELLDTIHQELEENPALEEVLDGAPDEGLAEQPETASEDNPQTEEVKIEEKIHDDIDWSNYLGEYNTPGRVSYEAEDRDAPRFEAFIAPKKSLRDHLLWQFLMTKPSRQEESIASLIVGNLNKDGFLDGSVEEIAMEIEKFQQEFAPVRTRNDVRLLYKMRLSPHHQAKYALFYEALKASSLPADLVPTNLGDFYIWDRQMLHIFTRLLRKVESAQYEYGQLPNEILRFSNYKDVIDATKYGVWSIEIEEYSQLVAYLKKQIELYKKQILLNNREL